MKHKFVIGVVLPLLCLLSCKEGAKDKVSNAVYVWNSRESYNFLDTTEIKFLKNNKVEKLYCKLTDVAWSEEEHAYPVDTKYLPTDKMLRSYYEIVPCIFFTNEVMLHSTEKELGYIAEKIAARLLDEGQFTEYQIDCDWSEQSKEKYFYFLEKMKSYLKGKKLSVTLRLYQYKYPEKAGVPPADRAILMLYNFKSPQVLGKSNTIFDKVEAEKYISQKPYKLPIDFALPSFSWEILYTSEGKFLGFIEDKTLKDDKALFKSRDKNTFVALRDTAIGGLYLRTGNILKHESAGMEELKAAQKLIDDFKNTDAYTVAIFDLNTLTTTLINSNPDENIFAKSAR